MAGDAGMPGAVVATELLDKAGGATELMPVPDLVIADSESLVPD
jgi:hypothetical protein